VKRSLEREKIVATRAIEHLEAQCRELEAKYGWTTEDFLRKFEDGTAGDEEDFFKWYAMAQGVEDWKGTLTALEEALVD